MAWTPTEDNRVQTIEEKLNEVQQALNKLATKAQLNSLLSLRNIEIDQIKEDMEHLAETGVSPGLAVHKEDPLAHPELNQRYFHKLEHVDVTAGVGDAGRPVILNSSGLLDPSLVSLSMEDHGSLSGLDADDHPHYLLVDGTRTMTGQLNMGNNSISGVDTIFTGMVGYTPTTVAGLDPLAGDGSTAVVTDDPEANFYVRVAGIWTPVSTGANVDTLTEEPLTYPVDYNLVGAATIPPGTIFTNQQDVDDFLTDAGTTAFKHLMDCWDSTPKLFLHDITFNLAAGVHRARPGQTGQVAPLDGRISLGGAAIIQGAAPSTWDTVVGPFTVSGIASAPDPSITAVGAPFTGLDLRGLHVVLSTGQVCVIHDHDNSQLKVTANLSPNPTGGTLRVARPSTIIRNSQNDTTGQFISGVFSVGMPGPGGMIFQDLRVDTFSAASSCWAFLFGDSNVSCSVTRCLNDYDIQRTAFGRPTDGRTFQNSSPGGFLSVTLFGLKTSANGVNDLLFASGEGQYFFTDTVAYNPATGSIAINMGTITPSLLRLNKTVIEWITPAPDGALDLQNGCFATFFDGFGVGTFCQIRRSPLGIVMRDGSRVQRNRNDIAVKFRNITSACLTLRNGSEWDAGLADANHGLKNDGGNTGVGIDIIGPYSSCILNAGTNVTGTVGDFRFDSVVDTYANLVATGPYTSITNFNRISKV